jgi:tetratricopeptide (TPR) repeat protein
MEHGIENANQSTVRRAITASQFLHSEHRIIAYGGEPGMSSDSKTFSIRVALQRTQAHLIAGQVDQAEQLCRSVVTMCPGELDALCLLGLVARACNVQARATNEKQAEAYADIALVHIVRSEYELAAVAAQCALELNPRLPDAYLHLAEAEMSLHRYDLALVALDTLNAVAPAYTAGRIAHEKLLQHLDQREETHWGNQYVLL